MSDKIRQCLEQTGSLQVLAAQAAFWESRRSWGAASRAGKQGWKITHLPGLGFTPMSLCSGLAGCPTGTDPKQALPLRFWSGRTTDA